MVIRNYIAEIVYDYLLCKSTCNNYDTNNSLSTALLTYSIGLTHSRPDEVKHLVEYAIWIRHRMQTDIVSKGGLKGTCLFDSY